MAISRSSPPANKERPDRQSTQQKRRIRLLQFTFRMVPVAFFELLKLNRLPPPAPGVLPPPSSAPREVARDDCRSTSTPPRRPISQNCVCVTSRQAGKNRGKRTHTQKNSYTVIEVRKRRRKKQNST